MKIIIFALIFLITLVCADEIMQLLCENVDQKCLIAGFEQTNCLKFGSPVSCDNSGQNCRMCETRDEIGRGIYKSSIDSWCQSKGGVTVTSSTLNNC